jgi:hypothetical protein
VSERDARLLRALGVIAAAGPMIEPKWDPASRDGFVYRGTGSPLDDLTLPADFEELAREGYAERVFLDRLSLCPNCESHALNVREVCLSCASTNLKSIKALLHFRCGYVGPVSAFAQEAQGRRCPKCRKLLQDLGTDHDSPGEYFHCQACNAEFQVPDVGARCLSCGSRFAGTDMQRVLERDVFAYRLTALGTTALRDGRLLEQTRELRA